MGQPAARLGDMTAHGGAITVGFPTVLIGGMPAARLGDMHLCPMATPGVPPIPHVGGPVMIGSVGVLIGGMPAARMGDMLLCVGPPDIIAQGYPTVLIGDMMPGGGGGGGAGSPAVAAAQAGAATAQSANTETTTKIKNWIEFEFVDKTGNPVSGVHYKFTDPANNESESFLRMDGKVCRDAISEGECKVVLKDLYQAKWSAENAKVGDKIKLSVKSLGIEDGEKVEFQIFVKDINYTDRELAKLETQISGDKAEIEWELKVEEEFIKIAEEKETNFKYSQPFFYFDAFCSGMITKSPLLYLVDWVELQFKDDEGNILADKEFKIYLPTGEIKEGKLDSEGKTKIENLPPGKIKITMKP